MGHSYVIWRKDEIELRDSTFQHLLECLVAEGKQLPNGDSSPLVGLVRNWLESWVSMPPGCKDLDLGDMESEVADLLKAMVTKVEQSAEAGSGLRDAARRLGELLAGQHSASRTEGT